ncbi:hypothetical protein ACXET9_00325 [Brachybacterium sp. DNPG3]
MNSGFWYEAGSLIPPVLTGLAFWFAMRSILRGDRHVRDAEKQAEADYRARHGGADES